MFTTLDLLQGYWQVKLSESCKEHTSLVTRFVNFSFEVMPSGLKNDPANFQKMMDHLLKGIHFSHSYFDDEIIHSKAVIDNLEHLRVVFDLLCRSDLKL